MDYAPKIPLKYEVSSGNYEMITDPIEVIRQNLRMIVLCSKGEKVGDYSFGVGLYDVLFEQKASSVVEKKVSEIYDQVARYLPIVTILDVKVNFEYINSFDYHNNRGDDFRLAGWLAKIYFSVPEFGFQDFLEV